MRSFWPWHKLFEWTLSGFKYLISTMSSKGTQVCYNSCLPQTLQNTNGFGEATTSLSARLSQNISRSKKCQNRVYSIVVPGHLLSGFFSPRHMISWVGCSEPVCNSSAFLFSLCSHFLRFALGKVNVRAWKQKDKIKLKEEYNKFKFRTTILFIVFPVIQLLFECGQSMRTCVRVSLSRRELFCCFFFVFVTSTF